MQEISLNILDVAQNSVTAGAKLIEILIDEDTEEDTLTVHIKDNGCGMTEEQIQKVTDPFYTTRTTRKVGLGVPLFKMAAEMSGGHFLITSTVGKGTQVCAVFGRTHIDRMPLGDMASTICTLVRGNPDIDFFYEHKTDEKGVRIDTREMREVLDGVPLDTPDVIAWIRDSIESPE